MNYSTKVRLHHIGQNAFNSVSKFESYLLKTIEGVASLSRKCVPHEANSWGLLRALFKRQN